MNQSYESSEEGNGSETREQGKQQNLLNDEERLRRVHIDAYFAFALPKAKPAATHSSISSSLIGQRPWGIRGLCSYAAHRIQIGDDVCDGNRPMSDLWSIAHELFTAKNFDALFGIFLISGASLWRYLWLEHES